MARRRLASPFSRGDGTTRKLTHQSSQLFDLAADPWELEDLSGRPEHHAKLNELKKRLAEQQKVFGDNLFLSESSNRILLTDDFNQHPFGPATVEFPVEDLFPGSKVELSFGDGDHDFAPHDLPFMVRVGIIFARPVMMISLG